MRRGSLRVAVIVLSLLAGNAAQALATSWGDSVRVAEYLARGEFQKAQLLLDGMLDSILSANRIPEELNLHTPNTHPTDAQAQTGIRPPGTCPLYV